MAGESQGKIFLKITVLKKKKKKETEWRRQGGRFLKGIERKKDTCILKDIKKTT